MINLIVVDVVPVVHYMRHYDHSGHTSYYAYPKIVVIGFFIFLLGANPKIYPYCWRMCRRWIDVPDG